MLDPPLVFTRRGAVSGVAAHTHRQCLPRTNFVVTLATDLIDKAEHPSQSKGNGAPFTLLRCLQ